MATPYENGSCTDTSSIFWARANDFKALLHVLREGCEVQVPSCRAFRQHTTCSRRPQLCKVNGDWKTLFCYIPLGVKTHFRPVYLGFLQLTHAWFLFSSIASMNYLLSSLLVPQSTYVKIRNLLHAEIIFEHFYTIYKTYSGLEDGVSLWLPESFRFVWSLNPDFATRTDWSQPMCLRQLPSLVVISCTGTKCSATPIAYGTQTFRPAD